MLICCVFLFAWPQAQAGGLATNTVKDPSMATDLQAASLVSAQASANTLPRVEGGGCEHDQGAARAICWVNSGHVVQAMPLLESEARSGDRGAQLMLLHLYGAGGRGVERRPKLGVYWGIRSFVSGARNAARYLAAYDHWGPKKDFKRLTWLSLAAEGDPTAMVFLGDLYLEQATWNPCAARAWYHHALEASAHANAVDRLAEDAVRQTLQQEQAAAAACQRDLAQTDRRLGVAQRASGSK